MQWILLPQSSTGLVLVLEPRDSTIGVTNHFYSRVERLEAPARIELATLRLGNECSIQLSYGATIHLYKIHGLGT
jgi:hypothetical protein